METQEIVKVQKGTLKALKAKKDMATNWALDEVERLRKELETVKGLQQALPKDRAPVARKVAKEMGEDLASEIERLKQENAKLKLKAVSTQALTPKVSEKGAVSVYGLGHWPVTLYASQWERLLAQAEDILQFIVNNESRLSRK